MKSHEFPSLWQLALSLISSISGKCDSLFPVRSGQEPWSPPWLLPYISYPTSNHDDHDGGDSNNWNNNIWTSIVSAYFMPGTGLCISHINNPMMGTYYPYFIKETLRLSNLLPSTLFSELYLITNLGYDHLHHYYPRLSSHRLSLLPSLPLYSLFSAEQAESSF